jgi:hypothetical protein
LNRLEEKGRSHPTGRSARARAILTVLNDPAQVVGRDYLWVSAAPVLVIEWEGELRMMTAADLAALIADLERGGTDVAAAAGLRPLPTRQRH